MKYVVVVFDVYYESEVEYGGDTLKELIEHMENDGIDDYVILTALKEQIIE